MIKSSRPSVFKIFLYIFLKRRICILTLCLIMVLGQNQELCSKKTSLLWVDGIYGEKCFRNKYKRIFFSEYLYQQKKLSLSFKTSQPFIIFVFEAFYFMHIFFYNWNINKGLNFLISHSIFAKTYNFVTFGLCLNNKK